ncbi:MAG: shikimate dehydrogenase [Pseudolabrys sp.]|nr:shikimate dehydrogenase [Pseudolabrys sp.]
MTTSRKACVIGWPIGHSRSPLIHNYWLKKYGIDGEYTKREVAPDALADFVGSLRANGFAGINVTIPHKQAVLKLSKPDERAEAVGAANTLWYEGDTLCSTNTDVEGFLNNLDAGVPGWSRNLENVVVLGAGGAARAVVHALMGRKAAHIHVVNRTRKSADDLAARFGKAVTADNWDALSTLLARASLLVNASSAGMKKQGALDVDLNSANPSLTIAELVYDPRDTALLKAARARGLRAVDGVGMLMHQAVGGFERWFGRRPEVTSELRALVEADLAAA